MELTQEIFDEQNKRISILENQIISQKQFSRTSRLDESQAISQIGSWSWDVMNGDIQWSDMMFKMLGLEPYEEVPSYELALKHVHDDDKDIYERTLSNAMNTRDTYYLKNRVQRKDKTIIHVISRGVCICNEENEITRMVGTVQDVTRINQLLDSNKQLEQFAHILSHDFKAPLRNIISLIGLIKKKSFDNFPEDGKQNFIYIDEAARKLNALVNDILEYSKLNSSKLEITEISIKELIDDVIFGLKITLSERNGKITIGHLPKYIYADEIKLRQVFQNLLSNSIKYTEENIQPNIEVHCEEKLDQLIIYISDNGIGIDKEFSDEIFQPYVRKTTQKSFSGTGMGLSICKRIVQMHSGDIGCFSNEERGSTFYFSIPKQN